MLPFLITLAIAVSVTAVGCRPRRPPGGRTVTGAGLAAAVLLAGLPAMTASAADDTAPSAATAAAAAVGTAAAPMAGYQLSDVFGEVPGVSQVDPVGIADDGTIAGNYVYQGQPRAFRVRPGQPFEELYATGATQIQVDAIAPNGTIAGHISTLGASDADGWVGTWVPDDENNVGDFRRLLAHPKDWTGGHFVTGVNSRGDVLLQSSVLHADGSRTMLAHPRPDAQNPDISPRHINEQGEVVGAVSWNEFNRDVTRAVKWVGGSPVLLNLFGDVSSMADVIADDGTIGMRALTGTPEQGYRTYLIDPASGRRAPVGQPGQRVRLMDLNDAGVAVGVLERADGGVTPIAFEGDVMRQLAPMVGDDTVGLQTARGINADGVITGDVDWQGNASAFMARPVNPVVFVHGAGASRLSQVVPAAEGSGEEGETQWLSCGRNRLNMSLWPQDLADGTAMADLAAFAPLRNEQCYGFGRGANSALGVYGDLLSHIEMTGFRPYRVEGLLNRYTTNGCDVAQSSANLFTFAYDWRRDNAQSAAKLADFMGCVAKIWPDRQVNIVTHSMGSLVAQRYLLTAGDDAPVERLITFGAPWLGSPKSVNVLYTGDFAPGLVNGPADRIRRIVGSFPAAHQLMAGPYYERLATEPILMEAGVDLNGDGVDAQLYPFDRLAATLDAANPDFRPGRTARTFQTYAHQADWSQLRTDVDITHFVGLQAGRNTIGTVVARNRVVCDSFGLWDCSSRDVIEQELICGDGTVPLVSATRVGEGHDLNAPGAEVRVLQSHSTSDNDSAEHTGITGNSDALDRLDELLRTPAARDIPFGYVGPVGTEDQDLSSCTGTPSGIAASASAAPDAEHALRYVRLLGGTDVGISDDQRHHTPEAEGAVGEVPGVTRFGSDHDDAGLTTLPLGSGRTYRLAFTATGDPLQLEVLDGTQQSPTRAIRWTDVEVPEGPAELEMRPDRTPVLRIDADGDGEVDTPVEPTVDVTGATAGDVTAPDLTVTAIGSGAQRRYAVSVTDDGPGVPEVMVSTGGRFAAYDGPFVPPSPATTLRAFATDAAGNRSAMSEVALADVVTTPLTTATRNPAAGERGWNDGEVRVDLAAEAGGGVRSITWWAEGATNVPATTVDGASVSIDVSAPGITQLRFQATAADGTVEPVRSLTVRIDNDQPTAQLRTPFADGTVSELDTIAGTAADLTSGVAEAEIELRDVRGRWWNGTRWSDESAWLPATVRSGVPGSTTFERRAGNPGGDDLPQGAYRLRVRVTDAAGRTVTTESARATVSADSAWQITELSGSRPELLTSARRITDRGAALGSAGDGAGHQHLLWTGGTSRPLARPAGSVVNDIATDQRTVGAVDVPGTTLERAVQWSPDGNVTELALLPGTSSSQATAMNDRDVVVGSSGVGNGRARGSLGRRRRPHAADPAVRGDRVATRRRRCRHRGRLLHAGRPAGAGCRVVARRHHP